MSNLKKNLLAVSDLIDQDHEVIFSKKSFIRHIPSGCELPMVRRNGIFELTVQLMPYEKVANMPRPPRVGRVTQ